MLSKVWAILNIRLSNIFTLLSPPTEPNKFGSLGQTSIHVVSAKRSKNSFKEKVGNINQNKN